MRWPPRSELAFYDGDRVLLFTSRERLFDLSDGLMTFDGSRTIYMGVSARSTRWHQWDDENLRKIEATIRYDLSFDGYRVSIKRFGDVGSECSEEFVWRLKIRER